MGNNNSSGGVGFFGLLTLVFIVLKLLKIITWNWFWVLSPVIILTVVFVILGILLFFMGRKK